MYIAMEYVASMADALINIIFLEKMFGFRENKKNTRYIFLLLYFIVAQYLMNYLFVQLILMVVVELVYCFLSLKGKKHEQIIVVVVLNAIYTTVSSISVPFFALITGKATIDLVMGGTIARIWLILVHKILVCSILLSVLLKWSKKISLLSSEKLIVIVLLLINAFIISGFFVISLRLSIGGVEQIGLFVVSMLIVVALIFCAILIVKINSKNQRLMNNQMLEFQVEHQEKMIMDFRRNSEEIRILKHDLKHYATVWRDLINKNEVEKAGREIDNYLKRVIENEYKIEYIKQNELINAVLYYKLCECKENNINTNIYITANFLKQQEMDIAVLLSNLLDNAIKAEKSVSKDKRYIEITISADKKGKHIVVSNYTELSVLEANPELKTTKKDKKMHGLGLKSVKNIAEKYDAVINISEEDNLFVVIVEGIQDILLV